MKFILKIIKVSLVVCAIVILLEIVFNGMKIRNLFDFKILGIYTFYSLVLTSLNAGYFFLFAKIIGWKNAGLIRVILASAGSIFLTLIGFFFCRLIHLTVFEAMPLTQFIENESIRYYFFPLLFTTLVSLFFHLIYFYKALQERKVAEQKIIAGTATSKFDALKNQLDPHFLFNSLNVLSALIEENPVTAQKFTGSLSKVYRYVLEQKSKELVSVTEELNFAQTYMDLLKVRFEDGIRFNITSEFTNPDAKVIPLSLQLLLENTVKHNKITPNSPLEIYIQEENGFLVVKNKLQPKEILKHGSGVGLKNIQERYHLITDRKVEITQTNDEFIIKLPLLTKVTQLEIPIEMENQADVYIRAKEQVKKEREFHGNLISYIVIIPALAIFNYLTSNFPWVLFPIFGWGLGVTIHAMSVYGWNPFFGKNWEERKIKDLMKKDNY